MLLTQYVLRLFCKVIFNVYFNVSLHLGCPSLLWQWPKLDYNLGEGYQVSINYDNDVSSCSEVTVEALTCSLYHSLNWFESTNLLSGLLTPLWPRLRADLLRGSEFWYFPFFPSWQEVELKKTPLCNSRFKVTPQNQNSWTCHQPGQIIETCYREAKWNANFKVRPPTRCCWNFWAYKSKREMCSPFFSVARGVKSPRPEKCKCEKAV